MGMTIDEALQEINRQILCLTDNGNVTKEVSALEKLVDITHRYQKIQEILNDCSYYEKKHGRRVYESWMISDIYKVVEDGND